MSERGGQSNGPMDDGAGGVPLSDGSLLGDQPDSGLGDQSGMEPDGLAQARHLMWALDLLDLTIFETIGGEPWQEEEFWDHAESRGVERFWTDAQGSLSGSAAAEV